MTAHGSNGQARAGLLAGRHILVTGVLTPAASPRRAREAIHEGAEVVLTSYGKARRLAERAARTLDPAPDVLELDVTDPDHWAALTADLGDRWPRLDGALHAVARAPPSCLGKGMLGVPWDDALTCGSRRSRWRRSPSWPSPCPTMAVAARSSASTSTTARPGRTTTGWAWPSPASSPRAGTWPGPGAPGDPGEPRRRRPAPQHGGPVDPGVRHQRAPAGSSRRPSAGTRTTRPSGGPASPCGRTCCPPPPARSSMSTAAAMPWALRPSPAGPTPRRRRERRGAALGAALCLAAAPAAAATPATRAASPPPPRRPRRGVTRLRPGQLPGGGRRDRGRAGHGRRPVAALGAGRRPRRVRHPGGGRRDPLRRRLDGSRARSTRGRRHRGVGPRLRGPAGPGGRGPRRRAGVRGLGIRRAAPSTAPAATSSGRSGSTRTPAPWSTGRPSTSTGARGRGRERPGADRRAPHVPGQRGGLRRRERGRGGATGPRTPPAGGARVSACGPRPRSTRRRAACTSGRPTPPRPRRRAATR